IGYVSPDMREHPVGRFMLPLLSHHDQARFEVYCYTDVRRTDSLTAALKEHVNVWQQTSSMNDEDLADLIRADAIDILVDLTMHMKGSRLLAFARKPAPVQVTYLAYCSTTGLDAIDYRLSDPYLDPPGSDESVYSEKTVRLPKSYWCYIAAADAPPVGPLPAATRGTISFGCLNNYCKVTPPAFDAWCEILRRVPGSRLLLHADAGSHRDRATARIRSAGLDASRLEFVGFQPLVDYLNTYNQ